MANLTKSLRRWTEAGVIDAATAERIRVYEFEKSDGTSLFLLAIAGSAALSVGLGILAIVAANWAEISASFKLGTMLLALTWIAVWSARALARGAGLTSEVLLVVQFLSVLAGIGLVGQIYQSNAPLYQALLLWLLVTPGLLLYAQSRIAASFWLLGFLCLYAAVIHQLAHAQLGRQGDEVILVALYALPFALLLVALRPWVQGRSNFAEVFRNAGIVFLLGLGIASQFVWSLGGTGLHNSLSSWVLNTAFSITVVYIVVLFHELRHLNPTLRIACQGFVAWHGILCIAPFFLDKPQGFIGAALFIAEWMVGAWIALQLGWRRTFHALSVGIALRILVSYFLLMGSLAHSGLMFIGGGILTLFLVWVLNKQIRPLAQRMGREGDR